jgi:hypothetical protein
VLQNLPQIRSRRALALLALAGPLLGAAPSGPPPEEAVSGWSQYADLDLVAWDGDLFAFGVVDVTHEFDGGVRGGGRAFLTPGPVAAYFDPNLPPGQNIPEPDPLNSEAFFHLSTWTDWLDAPGTGPVLPFDPGSGVTDKSTLYEYECSVCTWLEGPMSVDARATFRVAEGDVVLHNSLRSPAIGFTAAGDPSDESHELVAVSGAWIEDWIYVDGPGETATVEVAATIQGNVDAPVEPNDFVAGVYGDLTTSDPGSLPIPIGVARAKIRQRADLYSELQIGAAGTFPARIDYQKTLDLVWTGDTPSWSTDVRGSFDGDELVSVSREIPTGEWIRVYASLDASSSCRGALACDLDTNVELQVTSITASGGVVRSANGIAGTQAVPEPGATALGCVAFGAVALWRRHGSHRRASPSPRHPGRS